MVATGLADVDINRSIWRALFVLFLALLIGLATTDFSLGVDDHLVQFGGVIASLLIAARASRACGYIAPAAITRAIAQLMLLFLLAPALTYIAAAANVPYQDAALAALDGWLGLDWPAHFDFVYRRPWLVPYLYLGYAMIVWPTIGIPVLLGATGHGTRLQRFVLACILTVTMTTIIFSFLPAIGTYHHYGIAPDFGLLRPSGYLVQLDQLPRVRDGSLRMLEAGKLAGIIAFPSFHAGAAVLCIWGLWSIPWARPPALIANLGMLLATPIIGGHYFVDVLAGIAVATGAIMVTDHLPRLSHLGVMASQTT